MAVIGRPCRSPPTRGTTSGATTVDGEFAVLDAESLGALTGSPWIYAVMAVSVLLDMFVPVLPSGVLVITAATAAAASKVAATGKVRTTYPDILVLMACAAAASVIGDLVAYRLAWRGGADWTGPSPAHAG